MKAVASSRAIATLMVALMGLVLLSTSVQPARSLPIWSTPQLAQTAASVERLRQQQQQIERRRSQLNREQDRLENLQESAQDRLEGLEDTIQTTASQIRANENQLKIASDRLQKLEAELAVAEKTYQDRQFATVARLRFLQRQQSSRGWAVLLNSQSLNDFLDRRRQLSLVYGADRKILAELKAEADDLNRRRRTIERQKNEIALLTQELQAQKSEYEAQAKTQESLINRLRADRQALEEAESQLEKDSANIAVLIRQRIAAAARNGIVVHGTGQFSLPVNGRLTSNFGYRVHPILGYRRFHAGVDFGVGYGTVIRAADSGTVIFAGWYGGYGRSVIIDHGNNLTTLYAHTSEVYVSEGQAVQRGQAIAAVGSTGLSTGPNLHFEVRQNGTPVNPLNYL
ncbi:MAG: peptidoglycan DD-metalloendopeptidase family protein [Oculatellaceae cyanobacterium bins.114]|nr:peptidoglycan DD-metalloendopeptidase family protein [Oculatellaceae cyanobacterium bins.114]